MGINLPTTFTGIIGFLLLTVFIIGQSSVTMSSPQTAQEDLSSFTTNATVALDLVPASGWSAFWDNLNKVLLLPWQLVTILLTAIGNFVLLIPQMPLIVTIFMWFMVMCGMVAFIKILWWGE